MSARNGNRGARSHMSFMRQMEAGKSLNPHPKDTFFTEAEIGTHCQEWDCWIVLDGGVYDVSQYLEYHPGGKNEILLYAGKDGTAAFRDIHAWVNYEAILGKFRVGTLRPRTCGSSQSRSFFSGIFSRFFHFGQEK